MELLDSNAWKDLNVCKQTNFYAFKNKAAN